jgi:hypothetical protein
MPHGGQWHIGIRDQPGDHGHGGIGDGAALPVELLAMEPQQPGNGRSEQHDGLLVGEAEPEGEGGADEELALDRVLVPADQEVDDQGDQQVVEREGLDLERPAPEDRGKGQGQPGRRRRGPQRREPPDRGEDQGHGGRGADHGQEPDPEGGRSHREPAEHVSEHAQKRVTRGMRDAKCLGGNQEIRSVPSYHIAGGGQEVQDQRNEAHGRTERDGFPVTPGHCRWRRAGGGLLRSIAGTTRGR